MTSTYSWLESYRGVGAAMSFVIEGHSIAYATATMTSTYSADSSPYSQWAEPTGGLKLSGTVNGSIKIYAPEIEPDTLDVSLVDVGGSLMAQVFREASSSGKSTYLTANLLAGNDHTEGSAAGVIAVKSTTGFASSGAIYVGGERITYTGTTATTFTGCARASFNLNLTNGGTKFSPSHLIGNNVTVTARTAPNVTDFPRTWYGRFCHVFLHVKDPLTGQYNKPSEATKIWTGRIESYQDEGNGTITVSCKSALDLLYKPLGPDQWRAQVQAGAQFPTNADTLSIVRVSTNATYRLGTNMALSGIYTHEDLATKINSVIDTNTWDSGGSISAGDVWRLDLIDPGDGSPMRYRIQLYAGTSSLSNIVAELSVGFPPAAASMLGFADYGQTATGRDTTTSEPVFSVRLKPTGNSTDTWEAIATRPPIVYYYVAPVDGVKIQVEGEINSFVTQTSADFTSHPDANGVVQIQGGRYNGIYAVQYTAGSPSTIKIMAELDPITGYFKSAGPNFGVRWDAVRLGDANDPPVIKQVVYYRGSAGTLFLRCLLSSGGASGYNHATYDTLTTAGFGCGVPASLIDVASWELLNDVKIKLLIGDPVPFYEVLEPVLAVSNRYVVWKSSSAAEQPKLTIVRPSLETAYQASWQFTESNKADPTERLRSSRGADGIINRVVVEYGHGLSKNEEPTKIELDDLASQTDYGKRRTVKIDAGPVTNVPDLVAEALSPAFAYFSRPIAMVDRSYNASLLRMAPGDTASLADNYIINPKTGARDAPTLYCWVLGTSFDLETGKGKAKLVYLPEKDPNYTGKWAFSARVDETAGNSGYNAGTKTLTLKQHEFSDTGTTDANYFNVGDKVRIIQLDSSSPITWVDTVASKTSTTLVLTTGDGGLWDTTKRYVVEFDDISTVQTNQRNSAFIADESTLSTGFTPITPYEWGHHSTVTVGATVDYATGMFRPGTLYDDQGEPLSVHQIVYLQKAINNGLGYRTRSVLMNEYFGDQTVTGTTNTLVWMFWVPFFGHYGHNSTRSLKWRVRGRQSGGGTANFFLSSSATPPIGTSSTLFTYPTGQVSQTATTTSSTNVWTSEAEFAAPVVMRTHKNSVPGTWLSLYARGSAGGISAIINQIHVTEAGL